VDSVIIYQPIEFLPALVSHNHQVYVIVTVIFQILYLMSCVENDVIGYVIVCVVFSLSIAHLLISLQICFNQNFWHGAPYARAIYRGQTCEKRACCCSENACNVERQIVLCRCHKVWRHHHNFFSMLSQHRPLTSASTDMHTE